MSYSDHYLVALIYKKIMNTGFSGKIILKGYNLTKKLYFCDGNLVYAKSDALNEQLLVFLLLLEKITKEQYEHLFGLPERTDKKIGEILIKKKIVSKTDLIYARQYQARKIAVNSLQLKNIIYEIVDKEIVIKSDKFLIPLPPIIIEGVRKMRDLSFFIGEVDLKSPVALSLSGSIKKILSKDEINFYNNLEECKGMSNAEIITALALNPEYYWRIMLIFLLFEIIDFTEKSNVYDIKREIHDLIEIDKILNSEIKDNYSVFGVDEYSTIEEINTKYEQMARKFDVNNFDSVKNSKIKKIAESVSIKLKKVQLDLVILRSGSVGIVEKDTNINTGFGIPKETSLDLIEEKNESVNIKLKKDFGIPKESSIELKEEENEPVNENLKKDFGIPKESSIELPEKENKSADKQLNKNFGLPKKPILDSVEEQTNSEKQKITKNFGLPKKSIIDSVEIKKNKSANDNYTYRKEISDEEAVFFQRAEDQYKAGNYLDVINILRGNLKQTSLKGECSFLLGLAQSHQKQTYLEAEMNFKKAIELIPWNSDPIYNLGVLYKKQNKDKKAQKCFEKVLDMTLHHTNAVRSIQDILRKNKKKSSIFSILKKDIKLGS